MVAPLGSSPASSPASSADRGLADPAFADPGLAWSTATSFTPVVTGQEPLLGGALRQRAVWVDEAVCIGCRYCTHVASNTFMLEESWGRSRAIRQDGDTTDRIQEAMDTCPVDCIHWVAYEQLPQLQEQLAQQEMQPLGLPSSARPKRNLPRRSSGL